MAGRYFQDPAAEVATAVREAMSRCTLVPDTSPLEFTETSTTTIPLAMLPAGNWTSLAEASSAALNEVSASVEMEQQKDIKQSAKVDGRFLIFVHRIRIVAGQPRNLIENFWGHELVAQICPEMRKILQKKIIA